MTEIEKKALALVREVLTERNISTEPAVGRKASSYVEAFCRAIEQHEAFRQEVSDGLREWYEGIYPQPLERFVILPKPDPLVEAVRDTGLFTGYADQLRAAIEKRGGKIVWGEG